MGLRSWAAPGREFGDSQFFATHILDPGFARPQLSMRIRSNMSVFPEDRKTIGNSQVNQGR